MKKLLLLIAITLTVLFTANAQSSLSNLTSDQTIHKAGLDTVTNASSVSQTIQITGKADLLTFQAEVIKKTGTIATPASLKLYGSVDGLRYDFVSASTDTLAVADKAGSQVKTWKLSPSYYQFYKAIYKGGGTQTSTVSTKVLIRR